MRAGSLATLFSGTIAAAESATASTAVADPVFASSVALQAVFAYGAGGTTATYYVQTSVDAGTTWIDVATFAFATTALTKVVNLTSRTAVTTLYTPTDGSLADNTVKDGILGATWRVKRVTVGTYTGASTIAITAEWKR